MSIYTQLHTQFPNLEWQEQVPLAPFTYMKIGGPAEVLWKAADLDQLVEVVRFCQQAGIPYTILGGASNVLIDDDGLTGLVIVNQCDHIALLDDAKVSPLVNEAWWQEVAQTLTGQTLFVAETGVKTALLVRWSVDAQLTGLEPFLGVPGTLGGAVYNNSHYTSELIGSYIVAVEVLGEDGELTWLSQDECEFGYDTSRFHETNEVILRVIFALPRGDQSQSLQKIAGATQKRAATQPLGTANSGCMFRNVTLPEESRAQYDGKDTLSAGWLIDQAGLKGMRVGGAVVSEKHANFIVNEGEATAEDVKRLVRAIQQTVRDKFGVELEPEVFFMEHQG